MNLLRLAKPHNFIIDSYRHTPGGSGGGVGPILNFAASCKLMAHCSARPFIDSGPNKRGIVNMRRQVTLTGSKATSASTAAALVVIGADSDWQFGTGSFFVSAVVNISSANTSRIFNTVAAINTGWEVRVLVTSRVPVFIHKGTTYGNGVPAANLLVTNTTDTVVSFSYDGTSLRCFVDGALSWTHVVSLNGNDGGPLYVMNDSALTNGFTTIAVKELLIVKGESVYTTAFTPPSSWLDTGIVIEPYAPLFSNVKFLCHPNGSNGGTTFTEVTGRTLTTNGNAQISNAQARIGSTSVLLDGTGDYITAPNSADFTFAGDFSAECQFRSSVTSAQMPFSTFNSATSHGFGLQLNFSIAGRCRAYLNGATTVLDTNATDTPVATTNTWYHLMLSRVSGNLVFFVEGEAAVFVNDTQTSTADAQLFIGRWGNNSPLAELNGYLQEIRIVKGEGAGRSFTVQTGQHPDS